MFLIAIFLYSLGKGADLLVDEAVSLSIHWGVPKIIIGSTIVALSTSLPEVSISVLSAIEGNSDLALGNAVGSIIANSGLAIGLAVILGQVPVDQLTLNKHGKMQLFAGLLLVFLALPIMSQKPGGNISQWVGFAFLILLAIYTYLSLKWAKASKPPMEDFSEDNKPLPLQLLFLFLGITLIIVSSRLLIPVVEVTAFRLGIPKAIIAATLVAFGTSLPELVTTLAAVKKGHGELAVGNIVGSDIMNVLLVVGASAAVTQEGLTVTPSFYLLLFPTMLLILATFRWGQKKAKPNIQKIFGFALVGIYALYLLLNFTWLS